MHENDGGNVLGRFPLAQGYLGHARSSCGGNNNNNSSSSSINFRFDSVAKYSKEISKKNDSSKSAACYNMEMYI